MAMNVLHQRICRSDSWADRMHGTTLPWATRDVELDGEVLEIGPGYGVTTRWLAPRAGALTALEVDPVLAADLRDGLGRELGVDIRHGDGAALPFPDGSFDAVVCFTMLHHVPTPAEQDRLFAEAARVLRPGGTFAGIDSRLSLRFRLIHVGDTMTVVDPAGLPDRLSAAGLAAPATELGQRSFRFRAARPS
ncbi:class I SAM-dependent methyltransferase [Pseudonocardia sp. HH130630-07]|uniref:class I SAM-dependent methyltransferase n=1 Tax=Pseudonocardia sp. HH130630-07 TaxID=1690815 RepID=UPI0008150720|nr:class I SAM-dependent methyltransferase [Pseudonocardia sp. HH130630-07]ANY09019.1 methyltransferase type 11 [Pseudonocardia sp. HH130630-07]